MIVVTDGVYSFDQVHALICDSLNKSFIEHLPIEHNHGTVFIIYVLNNARVQQEMIQQLIYAPSDCLLLPIDKRTLFMKDRPLVGVTGSY